MRNNLKSVKYAVAIIIVTVLSAGCFENREYTNFKQLFSSEIIDSYVSIAQKSNETKSICEAGGIGNHVEGKAIVIEYDDDGGDISQLILDLNKSGFPLAKSPNEVRTVIALHHYDELFGTYTDNTNAYKQWCTVKLINQRTGTIIGEQRDISGTDPPKLKRTSESGYGSRPDSLVVEYLMNLSREDITPEATSTDNNATAVEPATLEVKDYAPKYAGGAILHLINGFGSNIVVAWGNKDSTDPIFRVNIPAHSTRSVSAPSGYFEEYVKIDGTGYKIGHGTDFNFQLKSGDEYTITYNRERLSGNIGIINGEPVVF